MIYLNLLFISGNFRDFEMFKKIAFVILIGFSPLIANAESLNSLVKKTLNCNVDDCPYGFDFLAQSKVQQAVRTSFKKSGQKVPQWLFGNSTAAPASAQSDGNQTAIYIHACQPHMCDSNFIDGFYNVQKNKFSGTYTKDYVQNQLK